MQDVFIFADDHGVAGIVAAGNARDVVERAGEVVDNLAFAFVAPLRAYDHHRFHSRVLLAHTYARRISEIISYSGNLRQKKEVTSYRKLVALSTQDQGNRGCTR